MNQHPAPGDVYQPLIGLLWETVSTIDGPEVFLSQFRRVPVKAGHLFAALWCKAEVYNGGFHQFFFNSTGVLAPEALAGFRAIGLHDWAALLDQAMGVFSTPYPRDQTERWRQFCGVPNEREIGEMFDQLDWRFYEPLRNDYDFWERAADAYAASEGDA